MEIISSYYSTHTDISIQTEKYNFLNIFFYIIFSNISKSLNLKILNHNWKLYLKTVWHLGGNPESASSAMLMTFWGIIGLTSSSLKSSSMSSQAESVSTSFDRALGRICKIFSRFSFTKNECNHCLIWQRIDPNLRVGWIQQLQTCNRLLLVSAKLQVALTPEVIFKSFRLVSYQYWS